MNQQFQRTNAAKNNRQNQPFCDFSFGYYRKLLRTTKRHYKARPFRDAVKVLQNEPLPTVFLRHDVDADLEGTLELAQVEAEEDMPATYMLMLNSPFYDLRSPRAQEILRELSNLGHELSLHFDFASPQHRAEAASFTALEKQVGRDCEILAGICKAPIQSVSFHIPSPQLLNGPMHIAGRVNTYATELTGCYLSDSRGYWREGEPTTNIQASRSPILQLLTHPFWWGKEHIAPEKQLKHFVQHISKAFTPEKLEDVQERFFPNLQQYLA